MNRYGRAEETGDVSSASLILRQENSDVHPDRPAAAARAPAPAPLSALPRLRRASGSCPSRHFKHRLRKVARALRYTDGELRRLLNEPVNTVPLCFGCHRIRHHSRHAIECRILPDEAIRFGFDALGAAAYDYFHSHYAGDDPRLEEALRRHRLTAP
jgi:hypothetical protein